MFTQVRPVGSSVSGAMKRGCRILPRVLVHHVCVVSFCALYASAFLCREQKLQKRWLACPLSSPCFLTLCFTREHCYTLLLQATPASPVRKLEPSAVKFATSSAQHLRPVRKRA